MSDFDDLYNVTPNPFSEDDADRLISGDATATRHSGEVADLGHLVHIARGAPTPSELANQASFLSMFAAEIRITPTPLQPERKRRMIKFFSAKHSIKFVSIVAGVVFSAGAAAAATGSLPDPAQQVVADAVSHIGIDVPSPDNTAADPAPPSTTTAEATTTQGTEAPTSAVEVTVGTTQTTTPTAGGSKDGESKDSKDSKEHEATTTGKITFGASEQTSESTKPREKNEASGLTPVDPTGKTDHASLCQAWIQQHDFKTGKNNNETALHNVQQAAWAAGFTVEGWCGFSHGTTATLPPTTTTTTTRAPENHDGTTTTKPAVTSTPTTTPHAEPTPTTKPVVTTTTHGEPAPTTTAATTTTQPAEPTTTSSTP